MSEITCYRCGTSFETQAATVTKCKGCQKQIRIKTALSRATSSAKSETPNMPDSGNSAGPDLWDVVASDPDIAQGVEALSFQGETAEYVPATSGVPVTPMAAPLVDGNALCFEILSVALGSILTGQEPDKLKMAELGGKALSLMANFQIAPPTGAPIELPSWAPLVAVLAVAFIVPMLTKGGKDGKNPLSGLFGKFTGILGSLTGKKKQEPEEGEESPEDC